MRAIPTTGQSAKSDRRCTPEVVERGTHDIRILQHEPVVFEEHRDDRGDAVRVHAVDGREHPDRLGEHQQGDPRAGRDERLRPLDLAGIVTHQQPDQDTLSTARMLAPYVAANALLHFVHGAVRRGAVEERIVNVLGAVLGRAADDHVVTLDAPLHFRTGRQAQLLPNRSGYRHSVPAT